jgi:site-specific recombinase XerD
MKLTEAIRDYLAFQEARGDAPCHRREYARMLALLTAELGDPDLEAVSTDDLREFIGRVRERPGLKGRRTVSGHTVFAYHRTLAAFFRRAAEDGRLSRSPMERVPKPRVEEALVRPFTEDQIAKLLAQPDPETFAGLRDAALMCFLLDTGCRLSEALSLTLDNLDREKRTARVMGKGRRERAVPFGPVTLAWLERYLERRLQSAATDLVFVNGYGERLTRHALSRRIAAYGRRAGIRGCG